MTDRNAMTAALQVVERPGEVGLMCVLPVELVTYIANGGDMNGKQALLAMDREQALVLADELRKAALAI